MSKRQRAVIYSFQLFLSEAYKLQRTPDRKLKWDEFLEAEGYDPFYLIEPCLDYRNRTKGTGRDLVAFYIYPGFETCEYFISQDKEHFKKLFRILAKEIEPYFNYRGKLNFFEILKKSLSSDKHGIFQDTFFDVVYNESLRVFSRKEVEGMVKDPKGLKHLSCFYCVHKVFAKEKGEDVEVETFNWGAF